ncbi:MAG: hypothetical protein PHF20_04380 [Halothiobacillaceae bacterium]|nr:hypothetical protein [Halothiobacillaceae bacterium]
MHIHYQVDINTYETHAADQLPLNGIGHCTLRLDEPLAFDPYRSIEGMGSFIVIDRMTNGTVGAGMIEGVAELEDGAGIPSHCSEFELELNALVRKHFPHWGTRDLGELLK